MWSDTDAGLALQSVVSVVLLPLIVPVARSHREWALSRFIQENVCMVDNGEGSEFVRKHTRRQTPLTTDQVTRPMLRCRPFFDWLPCIRWRGAINVLCHTRRTYFI